jgi:HAD superfamily hydrolase (TIGR01509 family)
MYGDFWDVYKRGGMSEEEYWKQISTNLSLPSTVFWRTLSDDFESTVVLDKELVEVVHELKKSYRIHALSNAGAELERRLYKFQITDLFNVIVNSHYVKLAKPDEEIYSLTSKLAETKPSEILFVDDKVRNTSVAERLGFHVHVYTTAQNLLLEMERIKLSI